MAMNMVTVMALGIRGGIVLVMIGGVERCIAERMTGIGLTIIGEMMGDLGVAAISMGEEVKTEALKGVQRLMKGTGRRKRT
jgi:hypothetical protein